MASGRTVSRLSFLIATVTAVVVGLPVNVLAQGFTPTGSMPTPHRSHSATLLFDGRVLVVCGSSGLTSSGAAELYNPATGTWSSAAGRTPCIGHTATLLQDGRVLVAGNPGVFASASVYIPATNSWDSGGSMTVPRSYHSASLLQDGRVLVAGGATAIGGEHSSAEIYNPVTNAWTPTGFMFGSRKDHTSTTLADGRVLVVGGRQTFFTTETLLSSAELYNPATGTWSSAGNLNHARRNHTATLLNDGRVLIAGGTGTTAFTSSTAEVYDPLFGFYQVPNMWSPRTGHAAAKLLSNGWVLLTGGSDGANPSTSAELFVPLANAFQQIPAQMTAARENHTATSLNDGRVLIAGGGSGSFATDTAELYDHSAIVPACTLSLGAKYGGGTVFLGLTWTSNVATTLNGFISVGTQTGRLWSAPIAPAPTPVNLPISFPLTPRQTIGFLVTMTTTADGILCSAWQTVDTGP